MNPILLITLLTGSIGSPTIDQYTQPIKDISFSMDVRTANRSELLKISKDFANGYEFEHVDFTVQDSFELRGDTRVQGTNVSMIMHDGIRVMKARGLSYKTDVREKPGQRQTIFDFGLLSPDLFTDFLTAKFVREDRATNDVVFDVWFNPRFHDKTRFRIWVDPAKKFDAKKEWYGQDGNLKATFSFTDPIRVGSLWFPTVATVQNADGNVAGVLNYSGFKLNAGLTP